MTTRTVYVAGRPESGSEQPIARPGARASAEVAGFVGGTRTTSRVSKLSSRRNSPDCAPRPRRREGSRALAAGAYSPAVAP